MVVNKRKKVTKYRAHTTHGGGHRKKRRGAGSRGGRGNAGSGKRAGHKRQGIVLGAFGFTSKRRSVLLGLNVGYFTQPQLEKLVATKKVTKDGDAYVVNLADLGYQKLLGAGSLQVKLHITATVVTSRAQEKVEQAGGQIVTAQGD